MSSTSRLNGFRPVRYLNGAPWNGQANLYFVPASDASVIMVGDFVKLLGDSRNPTGVPTVTRCVAGDTPVGVVVGISFTGEGDLQNVPPVNDLNTPVYRRASTDRYVMVVDDPNVLFEAQLSAAGSFSSADVGLNVNYRATAGNTATGSSGMDVDIATKATTNTLPLKLVGWPYKAQNVLGDAFFNVLVKLNQHAYALGSTGV